MLPIRVSWASSWRRRPKAVPRALGRCLTSLGLRTSRVVRVEPAVQDSSLQSLGTGHWRAISPGVLRSITVTSGAPDAQARAVTGPDRSDSQADSVPVGALPQCG